MQTQIVYKDDGSDYKKKIIQSDEEFEELITPLGADELDVEAQIAVCKLKVEDDLPDNYSQRGKQRHCLIPKEGKFPKIVNQEDELDFGLILNQAAPALKEAVPCGFCHRYMDQDQMIGPFEVNQSHEKELEDVEIPKGGMFFL